MKDKITLCSKDNKNQVKARWNIQNSKQKSATSHLRSAAVKNPTLNMENYKIEQV